MEITFVYTLSCPLSGHVRYIGKSNNVAKRLKQHIRRCKVEVSKKNSWLRGLLNKNLLPVIEILDEVPINEWIFWEQHYISLFKSWGFDLLNMTGGGENPPVNRWNLGKQMSLESRSKMSLAQKGNKNGLGKTKSEEARKLLSKAHKGNKYCVGRILSDETKMKIGAKNKGRKSPTEGKKYSDESKLKMSLKRKGIKLSEETRLRMSQSKTGVIMKAEVKDKIRSKCMNRPREKGRFIKIKS
jgi:group I intron endonuclease